MKKFTKYVHLDLFYVLDYSGSFYAYRNVIKTPNFFLKSPQKNVFAVRGGGGAQNVFFFNAFLHEKDGSKILHVTISQIYMLYIKSFVWRPLKVLIAKRCNLSDIFKYNAPLSLT